MFVGTAVIVEPKTSPSKGKEQIIFGVGMAIFISMLTYFGLPNAIIIGLFIGNIGYFIYRKFA
jgi:Na+-translocating ferredoxin:NAD+ oxidoreductase RnfD subunit